MSRHRFIPAGAGNSRGGWSDPRADPVHPRRCGEQSRNTIRLTTEGGSSPQVRGTDGATHPGRHQLRFIPAGAGNSSGLHVRQRGESVHPRRCGEQRAGYRPYGGGYGSSPQVRGTVHSTRRCSSTRRFIPAGAGNSTGSGCDSRAITVHPRRCGEQWSARVMAGMSPGSSPQVRGTDSQTLADAVDARFIPAGAGNRVRQLQDAGAVAVHPRRCGEQDKANAEIGSLNGSSPQVRGTVVPAGATTTAHRFIPAGAGNSPTPTWPPAKPTVHPRRCGEQADQ